MSFQAPRSAVCSFHADVPRRHIPGPSCNPETTRKTVTFAATASIAKPSTRSSAPSIMRSRIDIFPTRMPTTGANRAIASMIRGNALRMLESVGATDVVSQSSTYRDAQAARSCSSDRNSRHMSLLPTNGPAHRNNIPLRRARAPNRVRPELSEVKLTSRVGRSGACLAGRLRASRSSEPVRRVRFVDRAPASPKRSRRSTGMPDEGGISAPDHQGGKP